MHTYVMCLCVWCERWVQVCALQQPAGLREEPYVLYRWSVRGNNGVGVEARKKKAALVGQRRSHRRRRRRRRRDRRRGGVPSLRTLRHRAVKF